MKRQTIRLIKLLPIIVILSDMLVLTACGNSLTRINDRAGSALESNRDNFIIYCCGSTEEIADRIIEELVYNINLRDLDATVNMFAHGNPIRVSKRDLDPIFQMLSGKINDYESIEIHHRFISPDQDQRQDEQFLGYYIYKIDAMYRLISDEDTYICYYEATRLEGYEPYLQGLNRICIIPEREYVQGGSYKFVPEYGGDKLVSDMDDSETIVNDIDRITRFGNPSIFHTDNVDSTSFIKNDAPKYVIDEAYDLAGLLCNAINEGNADGILSLFSTAGKSTGSITEDDVNDLIKTAEKIEYFGGGIIYTKNFKNADDKAAFHGESFWANARFICKTDKGYLLLSLRFIDKYDVDQDYLGLWSIEAEYRDNDRYQVFESTLPLKEAGIRINAFN